MVVEGVRSSCVVKWLLGGEENARIGLSVQCCELRGERTRIDSKDEVRSFMLFKQINIFSAIIP